MKTFTPPLRQYAAVAILLLFMTPASAQIGSVPWGQLSDLFNQLNDGENGNFSNNLDGLEANWNVDFDENNNVLHDLYDELGNPFPGGPLDGSFLDVWDPGFDLLLNGLENLGIAPPDQDTLLDEFTNLDETFAANFDSLGNLFNQYQDSLQPPPENWDVTVLNLEGLTDESFGVLQDTFDRVFDLSTPAGPNGFAGIIGKFFNGFTFPDLELAFGTQSSSLQYWGTKYGADAKVIRVGSVPRFDREAHACHIGNIMLPIEPRWHVKMSWTDKQPPNGRGDLGARGGDNDRGFNPLLLSGDFAIMATPHLGRAGNYSFRLITSLGLEFGTYAPAHRDFSPFNAGNKGFATGFGPQAGSGFAMTAGPVTIYSMATVVVAGELIHCSQPYTYKSTRFTSGIRYGNIINIRYSKANVTWQPNDNRRADVKHEVTVGIILSELHL